MFPAHIPPASATLQLTVLVSVYLSYPQIDAAVSGRRGYASLKRLSSGRLRYTHSWLLMRIEPSIIGQHE
jgi:hypothetical protein